MATQQSTGSKRREAAPARGNAQRGAAASAPSASATSEKDEVYGLVSVLYHALQGAETYGKYVEDARRGNDPELQTFFQECQEEENERALRAKRLLAGRIAEFADDDEDDEDEEDEDEEDEDED